MGSTSLKHDTSKLRKACQSIDSRTESAMLPTGKKKFLFGKKNASIAVLKKAYSVEKRHTRRKVTENNHVI